MNTALVMTIVQALITLGPGMIDAVSAIIRAAHGGPVTEDEAAKIGQAVVRAVAPKAAP